MFQTMPNRSIEYDSITYSARLLMVLPEHAEVCKYHVGLAVLLSNYTTTALGVPRPWDECDLTSLESSQAHPHPPLPHHHLLATGIFAVGQRRGVCYMAMICLSCLPLGLPKIID